jgi:hypothetical protein
MRRLILWVTALLLVTTTALPCGATSFYLVYNQWGGTWQDANKTAANTEDDLMCWAAAASNVLAWGGWGTPTYNTAAKIFTHFQDHWTDNTGFTGYGYEWWIDGYSPQSTSMSYVDVPGSGNFYPTLNFYNYFTYASGGDLMAIIDTLMHQGKGVGILIGGSGIISHAVTVWGYSYNAANSYSSIFITDSDDGYYGLREYPLIWQNNAWYLGGGYSGWKIGDIQALAALGYDITLGTAGEPMDLGGGRVPIAPSWVLFGTGVFSLFLLRGRRMGKKQGSTASEEV